MPLPTPRTGSVLYLSVLDYPSGWRIAAPSRTMIPELKSRWPATESFEISDRTTPNELDMVRAHGREVRRGRRRRLRARVVRQRPARPRRRRWCSCCRTSRAPASGGRSRSWRCSSATRTRAMGVPEAAGDAADVRLFRRRRTVRRARARGRDRRSPESCRSRCRACSRSVTGFSGVAGPSKCLTRKHRNTETRESFSLKFTVSG